MTSQGMMLRNMALVGNTASATMPAGHRPAFEAGVQMLFQRWTALQLGVLNEWGGSNSREKAAGIQHEVLEWFYGKKSHEMLDLADLLDQAISEDFNIQAEDDSPYQLARSLVNMHNQVAQGNYEYVHQLQATPAGAAAASQNAQPAEEEGSSSSGEGSGSDDEGEEGMDIDEAPAPAAPKAPVVDADGFELVQRKGRGKGRP
uniref:Pre-rRNA-processing protein TSR2-like protein n=2 Tax=Auxenochlorella protothecoides TaxID=3075 RepID=A0A1D1ZRP3_AUXPR